MPKSFSFTHAICRKPSCSIINGLRAVDTGAPDLELFDKHHEDYLAALKSTGAEVHVLEALEDYPDSVFVEDAALCLPELAIVMRPGAPTRLGEAKLMAPHLSVHYSLVRTIDGPGFIEGGDILVTEQEILVGKSARTNSAGVAELGNIVGDYGYKLREVQTPPDVLHFKTDCSLLDEETILSTKRLAQTDCFNGYRVLYTEDGEEACANLIRFNDLVIMPEGFQRTAEILDREGYNVCQIGNSEAAKLDGGMSCLSLRFNPS
ncbi:MAG: dimethylarginine dimethylaminohydrolase [Lentilitoribacter sp.]